MTLRTDTPWALWPIALLDMFYSLVSVSVPITSAGQVTPAGWVYFVTGIVIVQALDRAQVWRARLHRRGG